MKKSTYWLAGLLIIHSLTGATLTILKDPHGSDIETCVGELLAGLGLIRSRRATERLEEKMDIDEPSLPFLHK